MPEEWSRARTRSDWSQRNRSIPRLGVSWRSSSSCTDQNFAFSRASPAKEFQCSPENYSLGKQQCRWIWQIPGSRPFSKTHNLERSLVQCRWPTLVGWRTVTTRSRGRRPHQCSEPNLKSLPFPGPSIFRKPAVQSSSSILEGWYSAKRGSHQKQEDRCQTILLETWWFPGLRRIERHRFQSMSNYLEEIFSSTSHSLGTHHQQSQ